jgi:hypothetical protein
LSKDLTKKVIKKFELEKKYFFPEDSLLHSTSNFEAGLNEGALYGSKNAKVLNA